MHSVVCNCIDDCTVEMIRNGSVAIVSMQNCYVYVINPNVDVDGCPLVAYVGIGNIDLFNKVIGDICRNSYCDSFFESDAERHLKNGYPVKDDIDQRERVEYYAKFTLDTYMKDKEREKAKQDNSESKEEEQVLVL